MKNATGNTMIFAPSPRCHKRGTQAKAKNRFRSTAIIGVFMGWLTAWPEPGKAQCPVNLDPATTRLTASDLADPNMVNTKFLARQKAANLSNLSCTFPGADKCTGNPDLGENYVVKILAQLANGGTDMNAAITSLMNVQRNQF